MRLGLNLGYWGARPPDGVDLAQEAERLGFDSVWTAEAYGSDAITPLAWSARTPADQARHGHPADARAHPGHDRDDRRHARSAQRRARAARPRPLRAPGRRGLARSALRQAAPRTREYVEILRRIGARGAAGHQGEEYQIPIAGGTGLGKPLKLTLHPLRPRIPIYLAAIGPKNIELAGEIADGWLPVFLAPRRRAPSSRRSRPAWRTPEP